MKYLGAITHDYDLVTKKYVDDATKVIQTLTSGTAIGSVGGTTLYAPAGGSGTITSVKTTAGAHSTINVSSGAANFNVPTTAAHVGALSTSGGEVTGNITLKAPAATDSPGLIFQRGTDSDNYNDWRIYDAGGLLKFGQRGTGTTAFDGNIYMGNSGDVHATSFYGSGSNLTGVSDIATYSTTDITAGSTSLTTGKLYIVYE